MPEMKYSIDYTNKFKKSLKKSVKRALTQILFYLPSPYLKRRAVYLNHTNHINFMATTKVFGNVT